MRRQLIQGVIVFDMPPGALAQTGALSGMIDQFNQEFQKAIFIGKSKAEGRDACYAFVFREILRDSTFRIG